MGQPTRRTILATANAAFQTGTQTAARNPVKTLSCTVTTLAATAATTNHNSRARLAEDVVDRPSNQSSVKSRATARTATTADVTR